MSKCDYCGKQCNLPFHCSYCGGSFCSDHRLPPSHNCTNLSSWKNKTQGIKQDEDSFRKPSSQPLIECFYCGVKTSKIFYCPSCGHNYCFIHKSREQHNCSGLEPKQQKTHTSSSAIKRTRSKKHHIGWALFIIVTIMVGIVFVLSLNTYAAGSTNLPKSSSSTYTNGEVAPITSSSIKPVITTTVTTPQNYEIGGSTRSFNYILHGKSGSISTTLYSGVNTYQISLSRPAACIRYNYDQSPCTHNEILQYYKKYLDEPVQKNSLDQLVFQIKKLTSNQDDQARIVISLVQNIPYDNSQLFSYTQEMSYPNQVLYNNKGVCSEKSLLLAYLLRELGYGVVLFEYESENHMAVGIKSPNQYSYQNSGYAFVESTTPSIITDSNGDYVGAGKLSSTPEIFLISDGNTMTSLAEEYTDARDYYQLYDQMEQIQNIYGTVLDEYHYNQWVSIDSRWMSIVKKYGIKISTSYSNEQSFTPYTYYNPTEYYPTVTPAQTLQYYYYD